MDVKKLPKDFDQAFGKGVIVWQEPKEESKTESGIIIPDVNTGHQDDKMFLKTGIVCSVGPEVDRPVKDIKTGIVRPLAPGDRVRFNPFADSGFDYKGVKYLTMDQFDVKTFAPNSARSVSASTRPDTRRGAVESKKKSLQ